MIEDVEKVIASSDLLIDNFARNCLSALLNKIENNQGKELLE